MRGNVSNSSRHCFYTILISNIIFSHLIITYALKLTGPTSRRHGIPRTILKAGALSGFQFGIWLGTYQTSKYLIKYVYFHRKPDYFGFLVFVFHSFTIWIFPHSFVKLPILVENTIEFNGFGSLKYSIRTFESMNRCSITTPHYQLRLLSLHFIVNSTMSRRFLDSYPHFFFQLFISHLPTFSLIQCPLY